MARSLQVQPEENVRSSGLLWAFLALAALWLVVGTAAVAMVEAEAPTPAPEGF